MKDRYEWLRETNPEFSKTIEIVGRVPAYKDLLCDPAMYGAYLSMVEKMKELGWIDEDGKATVNYVFDAAPYSDGNGNNYALFKAFRTWEEN